MTPPMYKRVDELVDYINRALGRKAVAVTEAKGQEKAYRLIAKLRQALESNMKMRGALAVDTLDNQEYLADTLAAMGNYAAASNEYMAVLSMAQTLLGSGHPHLEQIKEKMRFDLGA